MPVGCQRAKKFSFLVGVTAQGHRRRRTVPRAMAAAGNAAESPFDCPICANMYDDAAFVPCTLPCGHTCCLAHISAGLIHVRRFSGSDLLHRLAPLRTDDLLSRFLCSRSRQVCFACRAAMPPVSSCHPAFALRDAALLWARLDAAVAEAALAAAPQPRAAAALVQRLHSIPSSVSEHAASSPLSPSAVARSMREREDEQRRRDIAEDEAIARELARQFEAERFGSVGGYRQVVPAQVVIANREAAQPRQQQQPQPLQRASAAASAAGAAPHVRQDRQQKSCGHHCSFSSLKRCCACMDKRPMQAEHTYPIYRDGHGWVNEGRRAQHYCPVCQ